MDMASTQPVDRAIGLRPLSRFGAVTLALSGLLFMLYPAVRPWHNESTVGGAIASMSSGAWVAAHLFAILALILMPLGMLALCGLSAGTRGAKLTFAGTVIMWLGAGLALPYYGAEDFALHAIARTASSGAQLDLLALVDAIRFGAAAAVTFAAGLVLLGIAGVLLAIANWRTAILPRFSAVPLAVALLLLIPQFYLPAWARVAHGILVALALLWLAWVLWTKSVAAASDTFPGASQPTESRSAQVMIGEAR
jgi:hypothetical protein